MKVRVIDSSTPDSPDLGVWDLPCPPADRDLIMGPRDGMVYQVVGPAVWFPDAYDGPMAVIKARNTGKSL